jgi:hypothetical protein
MKVVSKVIASAIIISNTVIENKKSNISYLGTFKSLYICYVRQIKIRIISEVNLGGPIKSDDENMSLQITFNVITKSFKRQPINTITM